MVGMDTKTALLDYAERHARQRGLDGFSYADLARDVGIRKASIHYHFPTKADLALALMQRYRTQFHTRLHDIKIAGGTAAAQLDAYVTLYRAALHGGTQLCLCVAFSAGRESLDAPVLAELATFHTNSLAWLEDVFDKGQQDGSLHVNPNSSSQAAACLAQVEGAQIMARAACDVSLFDLATANLTPSHAH